MKGLLFYSSLFILLISFPASAQRFTGNLVLTTQSEIDNFNYSEVKGNLTIKEAVPGSITNLDGLRSLTQVLETRVTGMGMIEGGDLTIDSNSVLNNLKGLDNLILIRGYLTISHNASLKNIDTLHNFRGSRWLNIIGNPELEAIDGLSGITGLSTISINNNPKLKNIDGLSNLQLLSTSDYWWGFSSISNNAALTNLDGLSKLESIEYYFEISNNPSLGNIDGLSHLTTGNQLQLYIFNNAALTNIDGLSSLNSVEELYIYQNAALTNVDGLSHLRSLGLLQIYENTSLNEFCGLYNIITRDSTLLTDTQGRVLIYSNAANPSLDQILDNGPCKESKDVRLVNFRDGGDIREGSKVLLSWESNVPVKLEYRLDGTETWITIADNLPSTVKTYAWTVPLVDTLTKIFFKVSYSDNSLINDVSTTWISILNVTLSILNPAGNEVLEAGEGLTINWTSSNAEKFRLEYSINGGGSWKLLAGNLTGNFYQWITPNVISDHVMIRLIEPDLSGIYVNSNQFTITQDCSFKSIRFSGSGSEGVVISKNSLNNSILNYLSTEQMTLTAWVKLDSLDREMAVINKAADGGAYFLFNISGSQLRFVYSLGLQYGGTDLIAEVKAPININSNTWYHIAAVRDARKDQEVMRIYLNGTPLDSAATYSYQFTSYFYNLPVIIGSHRDEFGASSNVFSGAISEVQIYNTALNSSEIKDRMFRRPDASVESDNFIGYWKLDGNGKDFSNYHFDGDIQGNSAWTCDHPFLYNTDTTSSWNVQIKGKVKSISDNNNFAGVAKDATNGYDYQFDLPEPPAEPGNFIRVYFIHPEWNNNPSHDYMNDIRSNDNLIDSSKTWIFEVQSNVTDTITLDFVLKDLPENYKTYFADLSKPERNFPLPDEYKYYNNSSLPKRFMLIVGGKDLPFYVAPVVELITPAGGEIWKANTNKTIKWKLPEINTIDSLFVYSEKDNNAPVLIGKTGGGENEFTWQTPDEYWNNNYRIKIEAVDSAKNRGTGESGGTFTIAGDSLAKKSKAGFSLISIPLLPIDSSRSSVFEDDVPNSSYYIYSYSPGEGYQMPAFVNYGKGYWLTLQNELTWDVKGKILEEDSTIINLREGYNLIGNRYVRDLRKYKDLSFLYNGAHYNFQDAVNNELVSPNLYGTAGRFYYSSDIIAPFEGYWFGVLKSGVKLIEHLPLIKRNTQSPSDSTTNRENWQVPIAVYSGDLSDADNIFGVRSSATNDYDVKYDSPEPPLKPESNSINLWFDMPGNKYEEQFGNKFSREFKSSGSIGFRFFIESTADREVQVKWDNSIIKNIPGINLTLLDKTENAAVNMLQFNQYSFQYTGIREFTITGSTIVTVGNDDIPESFSLSQNYPNPFNPETMIRYALPEESFVEITLYNTIGQIVRVMENSTKPAGNHNLIFNASNLPSGIYIYSMRAKAAAGNKEFHDVKKLLLLK